MYAALITYKPEGAATAEQITGSFPDAVPMFSKMPGLLKKYFCFDDAAMEGTSIYIWESREAAEAFYLNPSFKDAFRQALGCEPTLRCVDVKLLVDNES